MAQSVQLPGVQQAVERMRGILREENVVLLTGRATSGKSVALEELAGSLAATRRTVLLAPPGHSDDAGPVMLVQAAEQLTAVDPDLKATITSPTEPWNVKVGRVCNALVQAHAVLLIDDPDLGPVSPSLHDVFRVRSHHLAQVLLRTRGFAKVVASASALSFIADDVVTLETRSVPSQVLAPDRWNGLAPFAEALLTNGGENLAGYSPIELRLMVALLARGDEVHSILERRRSPRQLVTRLLDRLGGTQKLQRVLAKVALVRTPFGDDLLERLGLSQIEIGVQTIVRRALLFGDAGHLHLHEALAREATEREWLKRAEAEDAHRELASYHRERFSSAHEQDDVTSAIRHEMEVVHHLTQAGDGRAVLQASYFFVEQLDALGKSLSLKHKFQEATLAYERALSHDPNDSYAHHYLAFNLDTLGREPKRVEDGYKRALDLDPDHWWHHGRLICFLVIRGRVEAAHSAWVAAMARFAPLAVSNDDALYDEIHRPLVRLLLHLGWLDFAAEVLDDVPPRVKQLSPWWPALGRLLTMLRDAAANQLVFPAPINEDERWKGPHLLLDASERSQVASWMAGRVDRVDSDGFHLRIGAKVSGHVKYGWRTVSIGALRKMAGPRAQLSLPAGTFVEIVKLKAGSEVLLTHERHRDDPALPPLKPDPDRYRHAAATSA